MAIETTTKMPTTSFPGGLTGYEGRQPVATTTPAVSSTPTYGAEIYTDTDGRKYKWAYDATKGWYKEYTTEVPPAQAAAEAPAQSGGSSRPQGEKSEWDTMTDTQKAAWYDEHPNFAAATRLGQEALGYTLPGKLLGWVQEKFNPGFADKNYLMAMGVDPAAISNVKDTAQSIRDTYSSLRGLGYSMADAQRGASSAVLSGYQPYGGSGLGGYTGVTRSDEGYTAPKGTTMSGSPLGGEAWSNSGSGGSSFTDGANSNDGDGGGGYSLGSFFSGRGEGGDKTGGQIGRKKHHKYPGMEQGLGAAGLETGGFVIPADVVSKAGNGSTDAGFEKLSAALGGLRRINGKGDGMSDSIPTKIDGKQPAAVAKDEGYLTPQQVQRLGGSKRLYAMLDNIRRQAHGTTKQQRPVNVKKALG